MKIPELEYPVCGDNILKEFKDYIEAIKSDRKEDIVKVSERMRSYILKKVDIALDKFYKNDIDLLKQGMNEMSVSGRLAMYLQKEFESFERYFVDIEYYRLRVPMEEVKDLRTDRIRCDIVFHSRGHFNPKVDNLLAIEIKLGNSKDDGTSDIKRLEDFVLPQSPETPLNAIHSTLVGLFIRMGEKGYSLVRCTAIGYIDKQNGVSKNE